MLIILRVLGSKGERKQRIQETKSEEGKKETESAGRRRAKKARTQEHD